MAIHIEGQALYWKAGVDDLAAAWQKDKLLTPHFKWDPGFRGAIGYSIEPYTLFVQFTHLHTKGCNSVEGDYNPFWIFPSDSNQSFTSLWQRWRLHLGLVDCFLQSTKQCSKWVSHFVLGMRYAEIRQKYKVAYQSLDFIDPDRFSAKIKFSGLGPRVGIKNDWIFLSRWSLNQHLFFSLLPGRFYVHENEKLESKTTTDFLRFFYQMEPLLEASLGLSYQKKNWFLSGSYEWALFFAQNQLARFIIPLGQGSTAFSQNLYLQGLTFKGGGNF
jgi:hypothetical protein